MIGDPNDKAVIECFKRFATLMVSSAVNELATWLAQEKMYPNGIEDLKAEAERTGKPYKSLYMYYYLAEERGRRALRFLADDVYLGIFTSFTSEECISFARRKSEMIIENDAVGKRIQMKTRQ